MAIFPNVCLWRRSYAQNWEVLTLKNCYSIEPPSYASTAYVAASYGPRFFSTVRFVNLREFFWANQFTAPPGKKISPTPMLKHMSLLMIICKIDTESFRAQERKTEQMCYGTSGLRRWQNSYATVILLVTRSEWQSRNYCRENPSTRT